MSWFKNIIDVIRNSEDFSEMKSNSVKDIINGNILTTKLLKKQYWLIGMIAVLAFFYIDNRYSCETQMAKAIELRKQIQDVKYESLTISAELMELSRRTNVTKMIKERGLNLVETTTPPIIIEDSIAE